MYYSIAVKIRKNVWYIKGTKVLLDTSRMGCNQNGLHFHGVQPILSETAPCTWWSLLWSVLSEEVDAVHQCVWQIKHVYAVFKAPEILHCLCTLFPPKICTSAEISKEPPPIPVDPEGGMLMVSALSGLLIIFFKWSIEPTVFRIQRKATFQWFLSRLDDIEVETETETYF